MQKYSHWSTKIDLNQLLAIVPLLASVNRTIVTLMLKPSQTKVFKIAFDFVRFSVSVTGNLLMESNAYFHYTGSNQIGIVENKGRLVVNTTHNDGVKIITSFNNFGTLEIESGLLVLYR